MNKNFYDFKVNKINGTEINLSDYEGKVLLIVNVASACGLTPQYEALEKVYEQYRDEGFEVLGFPANEFGAQEPGTNKEIANFCTSKFGVKFPMFEKVVVKGEEQHPLFKYLISQKPEAQLPHGNAFEEKLKTYGIHRTKKDDILWNFEKFLISKTGEVVARFSPDTEPNHSVITETIQNNL